MDTFRVGERVYVGWGRKAYVLAVEPEFLTLRMPPVKEGEKPLEFRIKSSMVDKHPRLTLQDCKQGAG